MTHLLSLIYDEVSTLKKVLQDHFPEINLSNQNDAFTNFLETTIIAYHHENAFEKRAVDKRILQRIKSPESLKKEVFNVWSKQRGSHIDFELQQKFYNSSEAQIHQLYFLIGSQKCYSILSSMCLFSLIGNKNVVQRTGLFCHYSPRFNDKIRLKSVPLTFEDDEDDEDVSAMECETKSLKSWGKIWRDIICKNKKAFKGKAPKGNLRRPESTALVQHVCKNRTFMYKQDMQPEVFARKFKNDTVDSLLDRIFSLYQQEHLREDLDFRSILSQIMLNHKKCFSGAKPSLVNRSCPLPFGFFKGSCDDIESLVNSYSTHEQVCNFIRRTLIQVFPSHLLGMRQGSQGVKNRRSFYVGLKIWVTSGYTVRLEIKNLIRQIPLQSISWLRRFKTRNDRKQAFESLIRFMIQYFNDLLSIMFYATETQFGRSEIFFFRREVWDRISRHHQFHGLQPVSGQENGQIFSRCRLIPKKTSVRMICPDAKGFSSLAHKKSLVSLLRILRLQEEQGNKTTKLSAQHKKTKTFTQLHSFVECLRRGNQDEQRMFLVKVDIRDCYPSIKHDILSGIVQKKLRLWKECSMKDSMEDSIEDSPDGTGCVFARQVQLPFVLNGKLCFRSHYLPMSSKNKDLLANESFLQTIQLKNRIIVPGNLEVIRDPVASILSHFKHLVKTGEDKMFLMTQGLRQGGSLSSDLCSLYMDDFIDYVFSGVTNVDVVYEADDILFATPDMKLGESLLSRLLKGGNIYNFHVNPTKIFSNFIPSSEDLSFITVTRQVPFCGFLFDEESRSIRANYDTFTGKSIRYSFNFNPFFSFDRMSDNLIAQVSHLRAFLMDLRFNEEVVIVQNLLERVLLVSMKFASYIIEAPAFKDTPNGVMMTLFAKKLVQKVIQMQRSWSRMDQCFKGYLSSQDIAFISTRGIL